ncbi:activating signal cointegrator 1 complex subunit 2 isoform X2 [Euwallacea fornicatus]|uniref:activating signal cointegrator 1 complex subunit 2 isoform X2 n=1 Tax=Euwallacea fornicatus TaxID=995702 RepID=UPI00338F4F67
MSIETRLSKLKLGDVLDQPIYQYINVFKNPGKLPINQIHIERTWQELKKNIPSNFNILNGSLEDVEKQAYLETKTEVIPALDKRWLPKVAFFNFEPLSLLHWEQANASFVVKNTLYIDSLDYLLKCDFHQFWCTVLFETSAVAAIQSLLLNPILPFESKYLQGEYLEVYRSVYNKFLLVYDKLLDFNKSEIEFMNLAFGLSKLKENKLLTLPIVITLTLLYKDSNLSFINKVTELYFKDTTEVEFYIQEVDTMIDQQLVVLEMIGGHVCGFDASATIVPITIEKRPPVFSLSWIYSVVSYLLYTLQTSSALFQVYKPGIEMALNKNFAYRLPFIYVKIYRELYELIDEREESKTQQELFKIVIDTMNAGRTEFVELFHTFISHCLDQALKYMGVPDTQQLYVETYIRLLSTALEDDYFICDYNATYSIATQNEMFESCCDVDSTRTQFIVSCIEKLPRNKKLMELSKLQRQTVEAVFRDFTPIVSDELEVEKSLPGPSRRDVVVENSEVERKIRNIMDMFPHLGDGFVLQCLQSYNYNPEDVINAILENNLPPHLTEIPFDSIRIPPEPELEKPVLAYRGKKPEYNDTLALLNDKSEIKAIKKLVLEGVQYNYDNIYDDEYDDRDDDNVAISITDNPVTEEMPIFNPNRQKSKVSEDEEESDVEETQKGASSDRNKMNFCENPAVLRERRATRYKAKQPVRMGGSSQGKAPDVVGKPKGQGQDKSTILNRQKKNVNKSSHANHNRKSGAQWKRSGGMIPS